MFGRAFRNVFVDLFLCLLLIFALLFLLSYTLIAEKKKKEDLAKNDNNILIMMSWKMDNDVDLWLQLPDGRCVGYNNRDEPPAHLDVDVVRWRRYKDDTGYEYIIENSQEVITIRDILEGEYVVNIHYYGAHSVPPEQPVEVSLLIQDVKNRKVIYAGTKLLHYVQTELHFARFIVGSRKSGKTKYSITNVYDNRPSYFVKQAARGGSDDVPGRP
jgi:hypothetical protein